MFRRPPAYLLTVSPTRVELWRRGWHTGKLAAAFDPAAPDFRQQLTGTLNRLRGQPIGLLLNLPDLTLRTETLPHTSWLDRRKLRQTRLAFLSHGYDIAALFPLTDDDILFATQPDTPVLKTVFQAASAADIPVTSVSHVVLEAFFLLPRAIRQGTGLAVVKLADSCLILAHHYGRLATCRSLDDNETELPQELLRTLQYLLRHRWRIDDHLTLTTLGLAVDVTGLSASETHTLFSETHSLPDRHALLEILAKLMSQTPHLPLTSAYLKQKNRHRRIEEMLTAAATIALLGSILLWAGSFAERRHLARDESALKAAMATLPPPLPIGDRTALIALDTDNALALPVLQALTPLAKDITRLQLDLPNDHHAAATLRLTSAALSADVQHTLHERLSHLADWKLKENAHPGHQGNFGATAPAIQSYTLESQP